MNTYDCSKHLRSGSWEWDEERFANATTSTMRRYLLEQERPLFTAFWPESGDLATHALPGDPYDSDANQDQFTNDGRRVPWRVPSPQSSGLDSSGVSSSLSDRQGTPWSPREQNDPAHALEEVGYNTAVFGGDAYFDPPYGGSCAMNEVQMYADHQPDTVAYEDDPAVGYGLFGSITEGYQPMSEQPDEHTIDADRNAPSEAYSPQIPRSHQPSPRDESEAPVIRRRRPQASRSVTSPGGTSRVTKRIQPGRASSSRTSSKQETAGDPRLTPPGNVAFPCPIQPYGCMSYFGSKNEWKRHVATQHMRLGFWRCDWCGDRKPNDFNRKDLFIQHVRRMHPNELLPSRSASARKTGRDTPEEQAANAASTRCYRHLRPPPDNSSCLLCDVRFQGSSSWDERMEHLGRHLEAAKKGTEELIDPKNWRTDVGTHKWLIDQEIIVPSDGRWVLSERP